MSYQVLVNSEMIQAKIQELFCKETGSHRRVIVVAYVGDGASSFLPDVRNVDLYCCPQAGGTNPYALEKLQNKGANVFLVERLHMKVYWVQNRGFIIGSANLTKPGLAGNANRLHEVAVYFDDSSKLDINMILSQFNSRPLTNEYFLELERRHDQYWNAVADIIKPPRPPAAFRFIDWYNTDKRKNWKLGWYDTPIGLAKSAREKAKKEYGITNVADWYNSWKNGCKAGDWLLSFDTSKLESKKFEIDGWMHIDFVVPISKYDRDAYDKDEPYQAIQLRKFIPERAPFKINDRIFKKAFRDTILEYGVEKIKERKSLVPTKRFLDLLAKRVSQHH